MKSITCIHYLYVIIMHTHVPTILGQWCPGIPGYWRIWENSPEICENSPCPGSLWLMVYKELYKTRYTKLRALSKICGVKPATPMSSKSSRVQIIPPPWTQHLSGCSRLGEKTFISTLAHNQMFNFQSIKMTLFINQWRHLMDLNTLFSNEWRLSFFFNTKSLKKW